MVDNPVNAGIGLSDNVVAVESDSVAVVVDAAAAAAAVDTVEEGDDDDRIDVQQLREGEYRKLDKKVALTLA